MPLGGALYTIGWEGAEGSELWRSDGTPQGTAPVVDACPGTCTGAAVWELVESGGILYFVGNDGEHGFELWRSDGTAAGTWMVKDVHPFDDSWPWFLLPAPGGLYFVAGHPSFGRELWWSDGTEAGTRLVVDLLPGNPGFTDGPSHLVMLDGALLFAADDGVHGRELYRSDGSAAGTARIVDLLPGPMSGLDWYQSFPNSFFSPIVANELAFFAARDTAGSNLSTWATDGTADGTVELHSPGASGGWPHLFAFDDVVLFNGPDRTLWRSDGTPGGTHTLATGGFPQPGPFARLSDRVYFPAHGAEGRELWTTDGTVAGTHLVKDVRPGPAGGLDPTYYTLHATSDRLFFSADDGVHGSELWSSDGTEAGTNLVADLLPGAPSSIPWFFHVTIPNQVAQYLLFETAAEGGFALWSLDLGSEALVTLHSTGNRPGSLAFCGLDWVCDLIDATPDGVGFLAFDHTTSGEPWTSAGRPGGTHLAADLRPGPQPSMPWGGLHDGFAQVGQTLLVLADDGAGQGRVFAISPSGVVPLEITFEPGSDSQIVTWKGAAFVTTHAGLFRTDGTLGSATQLAGGSTAGEMVPGVDDLFFVNFGRLWATDGTVEGTRRIAPAIDLTATLLADASNGGAQRLYFAGSEAEAGRELWLTDGTDAGTRKVVDLREGPESAIPDQPDDPSGFFERNRILIASAGLAYFVADDGVAGEELWVSDGSPGNATLLSARHGPESSSPRWLAAVGDRVYFSADDGVHGREPWISRGAPWDTLLLEDLRTGPGSSMPRELTTWGDRLALAADDGIHGMELWRTGASDEDHDPPVMHEIRPGPRPSSPMGLTVSGERLFFFADDGVHGLEPWAWPIDPRLLLDGFESGDLRNWIPSPP